MAVSPLPVPMSKAGPESRPPVLTTKSAAANRSNPRSRSTAPFGRERRPFSLTRSSRCFPGPLFAVRSRTASRSRSKRARYSGRASTISSPWNRLRRSAGHPGFPGEWGCPLSRRTACTRSSPIPTRLTTTPNGIRSSRTMSTASLRSCRPKGVGSVTSTTKSAPEGRDHRARGSRRRVQDRGRAVSQTGLHRADKGRRHGHADVEPALDQRDVLRPDRLDDSDAPVDSRMAFLGQTFAHPPQPWHISGKTRGAVPNETMAWYSQNRLHSPQPSQRDSSTCGTGMATVSVPAGVPLRKRWAFGSSTSQSRSCTGGAEDPGQVHGHGRLAGSALARGDREDHDSGSLVIDRPFRSNARDAA